MSKPQAKVNEGLAVFLSSTYMLYVKTQNFHWNVTGPTFYSLHLLFETHYTELAIAIDELAERIRALGEFAPGSLTSFSKLSFVKEEVKHPKADAMIKQLVADHDAIVKYGRDLVSTAEEANDPGTADLITSRLEFHEKAAWMLRSHLE